MKKIFIYLISLALSSQAFAQGYGGFTGNYNTNDTNSQYGGNYATGNANQQTGQDEKPKANIIELSYDGFQIVRTPTGRVRCKATFRLNNMTEDDISIVSAGLKWAEMETSVSFSGIKSGDKDKLEYMLLGKGCYSMNGAPEIELNRCRLKGGKSQDDCADMIRWK